MLKDQSMKGLHKAGQESRAGGNSRQSLKSAMEMQKAARKKILLVWILLLFVYPVYTLRQATYRAMLKAE